MLYGNASASGASTSAPGVFPHSSGRSRRYFATIARIVSVPNDAVGHQVLCNAPPETPITKLSNEPTSHVVRTSTNRFPFWKTRSHVAAHCAN